MSIENVISIVNSTIIPLGAGASFVGEAEDLLSFLGMTISAAGAPSVAPATISFEFGVKNGLGIIQWDTSVPLSIAGPTSLIPVPLATVGVFYRVRYVNGATPLTEFRLTTILHRTAPPPLKRFLDQALTALEPIIVTRSVINGQKPDGTYGHIQIDALGAQATQGLTDTQLRTSPVPVSASALPLPSGAATAAKQDTMIAGLATLNSLAPTAFDRMELGYTGDDLTTILYKAGGVTVSTTTITYLSPGVVETVQRTP